MRENEFEKRVHEKMEGFGLQPSHEVWTQVEKRIRKEKKRRFIFWWPFLFLLLGGGIATGIWVSNKKQQSIAGIPGKEMKTDIKQTVRKENDQNKKTIAPEKINKTQPNQIIPEENSKTKNIVLADTKKRGTVTTSSFVKLEQKNNTVPGTTNQMKNKAEASDQTIVSVHPVEEKKAISGEIEKQDEQQKIVVNETEKNDETGKTTESVTRKTNLEQGVVKKITDSTNNQTGKSQLHKKFKKWDSGVDIAAGKSGFSNGLFSFNKALYSDAYAQQSQNGNAPGSLPSRNYPSFSWSVGFFGKKSISKRFDLNVGLGYTYFSTKINTGSRIDSTRNINNSYSGNVRVENFYRLSGTGSTSTNKNKYHFISLSANISWQIVKGKKIRLYWENGFSYNRLLGSSMLHFDATLPGYYKDNKLLTKNHIFFTTGFAIPVLQRVWINPYAAYSLTPVLKNTNSPKTDFTNLGIRVKVLFKNKN